MSTAKPATNRIASLDQFRGYTVAGMFLVNFLGGYVCTPIILKHSNNFCSYADTIMPQFFFAVGFAFRLTFGRRTQTEGLAGAYGHVVKRFLGLALVALVIYNLPPLVKNWSQLVEMGPWEAIKVSSKTWFQTLMHIAVTSLWITPVIRAKPMVRVAFMVASGLAFFVLSHWFYFNWVQTGGIDGGVLGFLAWTIPTICGTLACDAVVRSDGGSPHLKKVAAWGAGLMLAGWLLSCGTTLYNIPEGGQDSSPKDWAVDPVLPSSERLQSATLTWTEPPFVPPPSDKVREENFWMMSQRGATLSYHIFAAGLALLLYAGFYVACDLWGWQLGLFRTLGTNALVGYVLHGLVDNAVSAYVPRDSPGWYVTLAFLLYFGITYLFIRKLEKDGIYLKL